MAELFSKLTDFLEHSKAGPQHDIALEIISLATNSPEEQRRNWQDSLGRLNDLAPVDVLITMRQLEHLVANDVTSLDPITLHLVIDETLDPGFPGKVVRRQFSPDSHEE
jgi:hypothetical protein